MTYVLTRAVLGCKEREPITPKEFEQLRQAKEGVVEVVSIEEKFDFLMGNFRDLEVGLLTLTTDDMLFGGRSWSSMMDERNRVSRMVGNLLSSCRMYLDHIGHHLRALSPAGTESVEQAKAWASEEYDSVFAYRFMEAHRNYTQHRGDPVHRLSYAWKHLRDDVPPGTEFSLHAVVDIGLLRSDRKFKSAIIKEIDADDSIILGKDDGLDLKPLIREYVQAIGRIHGRVRSLVDCSLKSWEPLIEKAIERFSTKTGAETTLGLAAARLHPKGYLQEITPIFDDLVRRRRMFAQRNPVDHNQSVRFTTGRAR